MGENNEIFKGKTFDSLLKDIYDNSKNKKKQIDFRKNDFDIVWPKLIWPFGVLPDIKDIWRLVWQTIKCQLQLAVIRTLAKIMTKLCELIGNALCNALALTGDILSSLPGGTTDLGIGGDQSTIDNLKSIVREAICGEDADENTINDTITDMIAQLGVGGAAFANQQQTLAFAEDMSASLTRSEMNKLFLGDAPDEALDIMDSLLEYEYPEFREALPNKQSINGFFKGMGNLMPASFKDTMRDFVDGLPEGDALPANPSLCLDPEKYEEFCGLRAELLEGRALPEQSKQMCDDLRGQLLDDLGAVSDIAQNLEDLPAFLASQLPPLQSDPGCDNGIVPYEADEAVAVASAGLGNDLEQLKIEFSEDMIGNGPGDKNWGMLNMMLSDTLGVPLTAHNRLANNRRSYVDYYSGIDYTAGLNIAGVARFFTSLATEDFSFAAELSDAAIAKQKGAFPTHVSRYLQNYMNNVGNSISISLNNVYKEDDTKRVEITKASQRDVTSLPDFGYNVEITPYTEEQINEASGEAMQVVVGYDITEKGKKRTPDVKLSYQDTDDGRFPDEDDWYSYGFDVEAYISDLTDSAVSEGGVNLYSDNMRIKIFERINLNATSGNSIEKADGIDVEENGQVSLEQEVSGEITKAGSGGAKILTTPLHEFIAIDDTLSKVFPDGSSMNDFLSEYTSFQRAFTTKTDFMPQTILLKEILEKKNIGLNVDPSQLSNNQSSIMKNMLAQIFAEVSDLDADFDASSWSFGSSIETLSPEDLDYGVVAEDGVTFVPYNETGYENRDMILGISRDAFNNIDTPENIRVFYLDPASYGKNYINPPLYIKPPKSSGWLGIIDVMFPELNACDPKTTDLVDFGEIQEFINETYPTLPDDQRALSDPDCVIELPYNRLLERSAKAGMMGLIKASIRIYAVTHFIKAYPTFTKFLPDFRKMFSSAFASYVVENMQSSFLDAQPGVGEFFNTFKDNEFWYGFLEQCVQMYGYLVDSGKIMDPPDSVLQAIGRLNDLQEVYEYPSDEDLKEAKAVGETKAFRTLKNYRQELNLEAVRQTEEDAKIVMKELVIMELEYMGKKFLENAERLNIEVEIKDSDYYFMERFTQGGEGLKLNSAIGNDGTFIVSTTLPTVPYEENENVTDPYYTYGGELVVDSNAQQLESLYAYGLDVGQEYIGEYHVHISEETGNPVYMVGPAHSEEAHPVLMPTANISTVDFGDVGDIFSEIDTENSEKPFVIEKYVRINDTLYTPSDAATVIGLVSEQNQLISDVYPGTLRLILGAENTPIGIEGELGVRYGLRFSMIYQGQTYELTSVEIDALDTALKDFADLNGNTKLLLCLINNLKKDPIFTLVSKYIFSTPKMSSLAAIYNDMGMLPSIGQLVVPEGETFARGVSRLNFADIGKPGQSLIRTLDDDGNVEGITSGPLSEAYNPITQDIVGINSNDRDPAPLGAWAHPDDRQRGLFFKEWDNWDKQLLRNSTSRIKRLFKIYYNARFYEDEGFTDTTDSPGAVFFERLREIIRPAAPGGLLRWWLRSCLRTNPFNANDEICEDDE